MDAQYTFRDKITHYKTKSVDFWGLMDSATKSGTLKVPSRALQNICAFVVRGIQSSTVHCFVFEYLLCFVIHPSWFRKCDLRMLFRSVLI